MRVCRLNEKWIKVILHAAKVTPFCCTFIIGISVSLIKVDISNLTANPRLVFWLQMMRNSRLSGTEGSIQWIQLEILHLLKTDLPHQTTGSSVYYLISENIYLRFSANDSDGRYSALPLSYNNIVKMCVK